MSATVLIVDDEDNTRLNIGSFLAGRGYEILDVPTIAEARQIIQQGRADIIILDAFFTGKVFDTLHKLRDVVRQFIFRNGVLRTCRHMDHAVAITKFMEHVRDVVILGTREHVHVDAHLAQLARQFTDVHVHAARILAAQEFGRGARL